MYTKIVEQENRSAGKVLNAESLKSIWLKTCGAGGNSDLSHLSTITARTTIPGILYTNSLEYNNL